MNYLNSQTDRPNKNVNARKSTRWISAVILALPIVSTLITVTNAETEEVKRAYMFERTDYVNLADKEIPEFHKRKEITDTQKRTIKGEWISIDRKNKTVKFRRTDGKEFDLLIVNLAPHDRRYAELETGCLWQIDPLPTPVDLIQEDILAFIEMDDTHVHLRYVNPNDPSKPYESKFQVNLLTDKDRAIIKQKTGREFPVMPRPAPDGNRRYWKYPRAIFGHEVPKFTPSYYPATLRLMRKTYTPEDMVDAMRTRTMTSAYIHEFYQLQYDGADSAKKSGAKSLADILKIIGETPSPLTEEKSIKANITKFKLALYEEKVPRDPAEPERFIREDRSIFAQPGVPIDGELQAFHFMGQYMRLASNKPKIPLATLLENTKQQFTGVGYTSGGQTITFPPEQRRKLYSSNDILTGIDKTYGFKGWKIFIPEKFRTYHKPGEATQEFFEQLTCELIRQNIRDGKPVYARKRGSETEHRSHGTQLVITGFKVEPGKPLTFEAISIKGSIWGNDSETGEYQIAETTVPITEVDSMTVTFLEVP